MSASINNISVKLSKLKQLDTSFKIFGSIVHQYKIGPLTTSNKMIEIEKKIGVTLPDGYRSFVMGIGNGGAGPYYGIYEFGDALNKSQKWLGDLLTQECPLTDDIEFSDECRPSPSSWEEHVNLLENNPQYIECWENVIDKYSTAKWFAGTIPLCQYGCGDFFFMTLTGKSPGSVWLRSPETGIYSLKVDFLGWYERWLNDSLERVEIGDYKPKNKTYSYLEFGNNDKYGIDPYRKK